MWSIAAATLLPLLGAAAYLILLLIAFTRRGPRAAQTRWLFLYLILGIGWEFALYFAPTLGGPAAVASKVLLVATAVLGVTTAVYREKPATGRWLLLGIMAVLLTTATDLLLANWSVPVGNGSLNSANLVRFGAWFLLSGAMLVQTWRDYRRTPFPWHANRLLHWTFALFITFLGEGLMFGRAPLLLLLGQLLRFAGVTSLTYAVTSYRLYDVRARSQRLLAFLLTTVVSALPVVGAVLLIQQLPLNLRRGATVLFTIAIIALSLLLYNPFRRFVERLTHRYLFGERINTSQVVRRYSQAIARTMDVQQLAAVIVSIVNELLQINRGAILLLSRTGNHYTAEPVPALGEIPRQPQTFSLDSRFIDTLRRTHQPLLQYEVDYSPTFNSMAAPERTWLKEMGMEVYVPIFADDVLDGIIALGPKSSGATFQRSELELLQVLADQTAVALQNARLFSALGAQNEKIRELNVNLVGQNERLEKMDQVKTDFITIASHELRTPLTQVKGYADILNALNNDNALTREQTREIMGYINRATSQLERIIAAMLDASQLDVDGVELNLADVRLSAVVEAAIEPLKPALRERRIGLTLHGVEEAPPLEADAQRLMQVFGNVLGNAVKYTPDHGHITVEAAVPQDIEDEISHVEIVVRDTGIGIDLQYHELIFEKFFRVGNPELHSTGSTKYKGAGPGLGLHIARGVVEAHHGRIWVESPGEDEARCPGSSFYILLPVRQGERVMG